jgi:hypothetical protein
VAIDCDHPRPALNLPGYVPPRLAWQVPSYIPDLPPNAARVIRDALSGVYQELTRLGQTRNLIPLQEDLEARPGSVIAGVGDGQTITLLPPGADGYLDPVSVLLTDVENPVTVLHPDGTVTTLGEPGAYDFTPASTTEYETNPGGLIVSGGVPTDRLLGRDTPGTGAVEFIALTAPLEFDGAGAIRIATGGIGPALLADMGPNTVLGNPTASTAAPTEIAIAENSVLGRAGAAGTGNIEAITVPGTGTLTGEVVYLQSSSLRNHVRWSIIGLNSLPLMGDNSFVGNISGATARPAYTGLGDLSSDTIIYENVGKTFVRQTMDGDVFADQNSNVTLIQPNVVSDTKLRDSGALSVIGRAFNSTGDPADISAVAASGAVLRESGSEVGFGTIATAGLADDSVTNDKLAEMAANTVKANATSSTANPTDFAVGTNTVLGRVAGDIVAAQLVNAQITDGTIANAKRADMTAGTVHGRQIDATTGPPVDLTGLELAELLRYGTTQAVTLAGTTNDQSLNADTTVLRLTLTGSQTLTGITGGAQGRLLFVENISGSGNNLTLASLSASSAVANRIRAPNGVDLVLRFRESALLRWETNNNDWRVVATSRATAIADGDYGDVTVSSAGATWTIDNDVVSDAKLRNSGALSVIGRSANSSGDPADISATAASDAVLRESGSVLGFGTIATGGIANNAVTDAKLRQGGALSVIGRSANSTGNVADIAASAASGAVLRESGSVLGFGTVATAGIADAAVTLAKMANLAAGTVIGRQIDAATGTPVALTGAEVAELIRTATVQTETISATANNLTLNADTTVLRCLPVGAQTLTGITGGVAGRVVIIDNAAGDGNPLTLASLSASSTAANRFRTPRAASLIIGFRESAIVRWDTDTGDWRFIGRAFAGDPLTDGDKGDITVSASGATWTIDNDVVTDAKLRNSAALSVIGRSANSTGDPADIAAANDAEVLRRSGTTLGFGTIATAGIANDAVTDAKLRNSSALSVIGRSVNSVGDPTDIATTSGSNGVLVESGGVLAWGLVTTNNILDNTIANADLRQSAALSVVGRTNNTLGNVADISAVAASDAVLRESGSTLSFGQIATAGIANDAVTDGKLRNGVALSVIGRSANSTGDVADIAAGTDGHVLRRSGTTLGFGTIATAGIADAAVTLAKMANLAQSSIIGRAESAGTGVPQALTSTQVAAIIDGEPITWSSTHAFNGTNLTANTASDITLTSGGTTTLAATTQVQITSPTRLASSIAFDSIGTTGVTAANNLVINSVNVVRFTGPPNPLTGMVPAVSGQTVLLVNTHATDDMVIQLDSPSSSAANRFAGEVTDRHIKPGEMALAWYDGTSTIWRLLCRDDVDL